MKPPKALRPYFSHSLTKLNEIFFPSVAGVEELQSIGWEKIDWKLVESQFERPEKVNVLVWGVNSDPARSFPDVHLLALKVYFDVRCFHLINST